MKTQPTLSVVSDERLSNQRFRSRIHKKGMVALLSLWSCAFLMTGTAFAQSQEELEKLKSENEILEQKLKQAENQKKLLDIYLPKSSAKPLEGKVTMSGDPSIETEILAYQVMAGSAIKFSTEILTFAGKMRTAANPASATVKNVSTTGSEATKAPIPLKKVYIYDQGLFDSIFYYQAYVENLDDLERRYQEMFPDVDKEAGPGAAPALAVPAIIGALGAAADIAAFFKKDTEITSKTYNLSQPVLVTQVTSHLSSQGITIINPAVFTPDLFSNDSDILRKINAIYPYKQRADNELALLTGNKQIKDKEIAELAEKIEKETDEEKKKELIKKKQDAEKASKALAAQIAPYKAINQLYDELITSLIRPQGETGYQTFTRVMKAEKLFKSMEEGSYWLKLDVIKAGGNIKVEKSLFRSPKMYHSGGVVVTYALFSKKGEQVLAGEDHPYKGYIKVKSKEEKNEDLQ